MPEILQPPVIPLLVNGTLDPEKLAGKTLPTYAKYPNPLLGDTVWQSWLGHAKNGDAVDLKGEFDIDPSAGTDDGFMLPVGYSLVEQLDEGQVFYSYFLQRSGSSEKIESKRIHFGVGKVGLLAAPQIKESHDLQLDTDALTGALTVAVAPYSAMASGDEVKLVWTGTFPDGKPAPPYKPVVKILSDSDTDGTNDPGRVLTWSIPVANAKLLKGGQLTLHYEVKYAAAPTITTVSAQRHFVVIAPTQETLDAPSVKDLAGSEIRAKDFPEGIRVVVRVYPDIRVGDDVLVYATGASADQAKTVVEHLRIDTSAIESGRIELPVAASWLVANEGEKVNLRYQYARPDAAGSSALLQLSVLEARVLPAPTVDRSVVANGQSELDPIKVIEGAFIAIPPEATIVEGDKVTARWKGFNASGSYETQTPSQTLPMKFKVPASYIPANFNRTIEVVYQVGAEVSTPLTLLIRPLSNYPRTNCDKAQTGSPATLSRAAVNAGGAGLNVGPWSFISTEHIVRMWLTASNIEREIIAPRQVNAGEISTGVNARLTIAHLDGIALQKYFTLKVSVSFDGGASTIVFPNALQLKLVP